MGGILADLELTCQYLHMSCTPLQQKDYINEYGINYNKSDEKSWDLENKSIENANDTGYYYVTGVVILKGLKGEKIAFELEYTDGYFDKIIGTPYDTDEFGNEHGIYFV